METVFRAFDEPGVELDRLAGEKFPWGVSDGN
jgi:hypothetical protein